LKQSPLGDAQLHVGRLGYEAGVSLDQAPVEEGLGAETPAPFFVGDQVEYQVAGRRNPGLIQDVQRTDGGRDPAFHIGGSPAVQTSVEYLRIERVVGPGGGADGHDIQVSVDDQREAVRARALWVVQFGDERKPPGRRLDGGPSGPPPVEGLSDHPFYRALVARRVAGVHCD